MTKNKEIKIRFTYQRDIRKWIIPVTDEMRKMFGLTNDKERPKVVSEGRFRVEFPHDYEGSYIIFMPDEG